MLLESSTYTLSSSMESGKEVEHKRGNGDVVVSITGIEEASKKDKKMGELASPSVQLTELESQNSQQHIFAEAPRTSGSFTKNKKPKMGESTSINSPRMASPNELESQKSQENIFAETARTSGSFTKNKPPKMGESTSINSPRMASPNELESQKSQENVFAETARTSGSFTKSRPPKTGESTSINSPRIASPTELESKKSQEQIFPETTRASGSFTKNKPPKIPAEETVLDRPMLTRPTLAKHRSRLVESPPPNLHHHSKYVSSSSPGRGSPHAMSPSRRSSSGTPRRNSRTAFITMETPLISSQKEKDTDADDDDDDDDEGDDNVYQSDQVVEEKKSGKKWKLLMLFELTVFSTLISFLIACLTVKSIQHRTIRGMVTWKWAVLLLVISCGRLFSEWFIDIIVFLIERNFLLKKKALYFVHGLKNSVQVFFWLVLILGTWVLLIDRAVRRSKHTTKVLNHVTRGLGASLLGVGMWMAKTLFIKAVASSFHVKRFFDRIQDSIFYQYVLLTLSGPPMIEYFESMGKSRRLLSLGRRKEGKKVEKEGVDMELLHKMNQEKISAWTIWGLIKVIQDSRLSIVLNSLEVSFKDDEGVKIKDQKITTSWEAKAAAQRIFRNVARRGQNYIDEDDLLCFMKKDDVYRLLLTFDGAGETRRVEKSALKNWAVNVYKERKLLAHSLDDTKTAIEELNRILSGIVLIVILIVWLLIMGIATTKILVFISSQLLLAGFIFGSTCKTVFESLVFVFIMHPFDIGDRCVVDGVQMIVEEMNILSTVFLRYDKEMISYPNSVLATKPISNFFRSPEMGDTVDFDVDISTPAEKIESLKAKIKAYIHNKPKYWFPEHHLQIKDIENVSSIRLGLYVNHTMNFQDFNEKMSRKTELVLELKKIFEELGINFQLAPQENQLRDIEAEARKT